MRKIGIIVDSCSSLSEKYILENDIGVVRFSYDLDEVVCLEGLDETDEKYYSRLKKSSNFPKTSQPSPGEYLEVCKSFLDKYDDILVFPLSSGLSGSYHTACLIGEHFENLHIVNTFLALDAIRFVVERAVELIDMDKSVLEIKAILEKEIINKNYGGFFVTNNLEYLQRGGRIPKSLSKIGDFLNLKPIIEMNTDKKGKLSLKEISRGNKRTIMRIVELLPKDAKKVAVGEIYNKEIKEELIELVKNKLPNAEISDCTVTPVIASHIGPNCYVLAYSRV